MSSKTLDLKSRFIIYGICGWINLLILDATAIIDAILDRFSPAFYPKKLSMKESVYAGQKT